MKNERQPLSRRLSIAAHNFGEIVFGGTETTAHIQNPAITLVDSSLAHQGLIAVTPTNRRQRRGNRTWSDQTFVPSNKRFNQGKGDQSIASTSEGS